MKKALATGATGQDGAHLVECLLGKGREAHGRRISLFKAKLGWTPRISFDELVAEMVREDLKAAERGELIKQHGYRAMDKHE